MPNWEIFTQFGIAGLILGVFFVMFMSVLRMNAKTVEGIIKRLSTDHKESNEAWRVTFQRAEDRADQRQAETNDVLRELAAALTSTKKIPEKRTMSRV